ncbi:MAG: PSD1 and planctomycete cytochrome C domain-containing protein [Planctomycetota bacterium]|nr:PSD1 and planctomycete cytochrome C domain-containing protein [Planctomycetota bacterium]
MQRNSHTTERSAAALCLLLAIGLFVQRSLHAEPAKPAPAQAAIESGNKPALPVDEKKPGDVNYQLDILPIFQRACYRCHGPEKQKSGYRLDVRNVALKGGENYAPNIVPHKSGESSLIEFVSATDDTRMPPDGERLSAAEIELLKQWIDSGAGWPNELAGEVSEKTKRAEEWWSLQPLTRPEVPTATSTSGDHPVDRFIRTKLAEQKLAPAPRADRTTLIRRLYYDLIGLPPTPAEVAAFVADTDPRAYEKIVDRLLASPRYGERWARHWIDAVHFAETHGHGQDSVREHAWRYRDFLIQSFNSDKPYTQFIQEQVAGDTLSSDPQAAIGLGMIAAGPWDESSLKDTQEKTLDREIGRYIDRDDMLGTVMNNVVSMTVQCARCHDHKFDPISQEDYYSLQAVFAGVDRANREIETSAEVRDRRKLLLRQKRWLEGRTSEGIALIGTPDWQKTTAEFEQRVTGGTTNWTILTAAQLHADGEVKLNSQPDGSILSSGALPEVANYTVTCEIPLERITAVRLEVLPDDSLPQRGPGRQPNGNLHLSEFEVYLEKYEHLVKLDAALADFQETGFEITKAIDNDHKTSWGIFPEVGKPHTATFRLTESLQGARAKKLHVILRQQRGDKHLVGKFRLSVTDADPARDLLPAHLAKIVDTPADNRTVEEQRDLAIYAGLQWIERELKSLPDPIMVYAASNDFKPQNSFRPAERPRAVHMLHRGEISDPRQEAVPGALTAINGIPARFENINRENEAERRAALARWLTADANPLTWRSIVNRVWHHHFGAGLVRTLNDFGQLGDTPSHAELLNWLAYEFRSQGGSLKKLHRLLVTSQTYQQISKIEALDATAVAAAQAVDRDNRLLWRMNRTRLDAECVHDAILLFVDRLDLRMGGPSDRQFALKKGVHITPDINYDNFDVLGPAGRRRSIYRFLFRTLPDPFMSALDCPSGDLFTPVRLNTVTVQQALAMWNDQFILQNSNELAKRLQRDAKTVDEQIALAARLIYLRAPTEVEQREWSEFVTQHGLPNLCRVLLNTNEFLYVE